MIDHTSGGADDDLSTAAQPGELDTVGLTAVDGQHMQARDVRRILTESLRYLQREFSGGRKHERWGRFFEVSIRERMGTANAAVLPVPV